AIEAANTEITALAPRIAFVTITIEGGVQPRATLDGFGLSPATWGIKRPADPGKHVARAGDYGFAPGEVVFQLAEGATETIAMKLVPSRAPRPSWGYTPASGRAGGAG